jgi:hypothetical protein
MDELTQIEAKLKSLQEIINIQDPIVRLSGVKLIEECMALTHSLLSKGDSVENNERKFKFHSDASHGWLSVKRDLIYKLKLENKISRFSYQKGSTVYLEEDMDMTTFINAFTVANGYKPMIIEQPSVQRSMIRSYESFYA